MSDAMATISPSPMRPRAFTLTQFRKIRAMRADGLADLQIAAEFGCPSLEWLKLRVRAQRRRVLADLKARK